MVIRLLRLELTINNHFKKYFNCELINKMEIHGNVLLDWKILLIIWPFERKF